MEQVKKGLAKAGVPYVSECLGGNIEGIRIGNMYIVEHGSGEGYYFGTLDDEGDTSYTLEEVLELVANYKEEATTMKKTYYLVQMVKGTDQTYDETSEPRTLLKTYDKQEALDFYDTLPDHLELEEPETDLSGNLKYEAPVIVAASPDGKDLLKG